MQRTFTKTYAERLREEGYSEQGIEHFVKESEANRTSPNAAAEHAVQLVDEMNSAQRAQAENATPTSPRAFFNADGNYNQNVIAKTKLTDVDMTKLIENKVAFTNEQIGNMSEKQLGYALNALMPSFVEETKNNQAFAEVPLLIGKAQKTSDIKGMRDYVQIFLNIVLANSLYCRLVV